MYKWIAAASELQTQNKLLEKNWYTYQFLSALAQSFPYNNGLVCNDLH